MKIQYYYRMRKLHQKQMEDEKRNSKLKIEKGRLLSNMMNYIIKFQYRKLRLKQLLKTLNKMFEQKRKEMVISSVILIQYNARRWLKRLRLAREQLENEKGKFIKIIKTCN